MHGDTGVQGDTGVGGDVQGDTGVQGDTPPGLAPAAAVPNAHQAELALARAQMMDAVRLAYDASKRVRTFLATPEAIAQEQAAWLQVQALTSVYRALLEAGPQA